jgi:glutamyl-tRNA synthetase
MLFASPARSRDGRFAPSPTGDLHLGNLRTALLAWLFARSAGAQFVVRMEDLDAERVRTGMAERQVDDLRGLGLDWDGPIIRQSERLHLYAEAVDHLDAAGLLYPCFCTRAEIREAVSAPHGSPRPYPGTCRTLSTTERARREAAGRPALRLNARDATVAFEDELLGRRSQEVDDFVVRRGDGAPAYNLAVVIDDAAQGIGQVVRGADLVDSTPRQVLLARLLQLAPAAYAHVPLVLGPDGGRLAKRHGAVTLSDRLAQGESAASVRSWLAASVGLAEIGEDVDTETLVERFDPEALPAEPTRLDAEGLLPAAA